MHPPVLGCLQVIIERFANVVTQCITPLKALGRLKDAEIYHDLNPLKKIVLVEEFKISQNTLLLLDARLESKIDILVEVWILEQEEVEESV